VPHIGPEVVEVEVEVVVVVVVVVEVVVVVVVVEVVVVVVGSTVVVVTVVAPHRFNLTPLFFVNFITFVICPSTVSQMKL